MILAGAFIVLTVLAVISSIYMAEAEDEGTGSLNSQSPPEVLEFEAIQNGMALAYPMINNKQQISYIYIENTTVDKETEVKTHNKYGFDYSNDLSTLVLFYYKDGKKVDYMPGICEEDRGFSYSSLFAIETGDGFSQYTLIDYLCLAIQSPYFDKRIELAEKGSDAYNDQLKEFGLVGDDVATLTFTYIDEFDVETEHTLKIGKRSATGTGFYYMVDDRNYVYSSLNNYLNYALSEMQVFVKPLLVSAGLAEDKGFGPYLATGYYQWLGKLHTGDCECDKYECPCLLKGDECLDGDCANCDCVCRVTETTSDSKVLAYTDTITSSALNSLGTDLIEIDLGNAADQLKAYKKDYDEYTERYLKNLASYEQYKLDFEELDDAAKEAKRAEYEANVKKFEAYTKKYENYKATYLNQKENYERAINALTGLSIGECDVVYTLASPSKFLDFAENDTILFSYEVTEIEAIITDKGDVFEGSAASAGSHLIRVKYNALANGLPISLGDICAVIDLSSAALPKEAADKLSSAEVGRCNIAFAVSYTKDNAISRSGVKVITEILDIADAKTNKVLDKVTSSSIVVFRYTVYVDGVEMGSAIDGLDLTSVTEAEDVLIKNKLIGKSKGALEIELEEQYSYYEAFMDFATYEVSEIYGFVTRELISAFKFQNSSKRDPYYGESLYENLLEDEHRLYGLNSSVCEAVVKILGGVSDESTSATANGLSGDSVVAVGLDPETKEKYGLYAHTIYFELPRGIIAYDPEGDESSSDTLDDYDHHETLGFYLYISDVDLKTGRRYIASDLYDVVTTVPAEDFVFLNYDFESFWARRNILLMDIADINYFGIEFYLEDVKGNYMFELLQPTTEGGNLEISVSASGECTDNKLIEYLADEKYPKNYLGAASMKDFYEYMSNATAEDYKAVLPDSLGVSSFKDAMRMVYFMTYTDVMPEDERVPKAENLVMRMTLLLEESTKNASPHTYVYEFYICDDYDRRILVNIYQQDSSGNMIGEMHVSDFYISMFAFKKIVANFTGVLNAELIEPDIGYIDDVKKD